MVDRAAFAETFATFFLAATAERKFPAKIKQIKRIPPSKQWMPVGYGPDGPTPPLTFVFERYFTYGVPFDIEPYIYSGLSMGNGASGSVNLTFRCAGYSVAGAPSYTGVPAQGRPREASLPQVRRMALRLRIRRISNRPSPSGMGTQEPNARLRSTLCRQTPANKSSATLWTSKARARIWS
jgi:hypothetical protein